MDIIKTLAKELDRKEEHVQNVVTLLDEGNTVPFIAPLPQGDARHDGRPDHPHPCRPPAVSSQSRREEKGSPLFHRGAGEADGGASRPHRRRGDARRRRGRVPSLQAEEAHPRDHRPRKGPGAARPCSSSRRRRTASAPEEAAKEYIDEEKGVSSVEEALAGAGDIIAETISDDARRARGAPRLCHEVRRCLLGGRQEGTPRTPSTATTIKFTCAVKTIPGHRVLALNRGEKEGVLKVWVDVPRDNALELIFRRVVKKPVCASTAFVKAAAEDAYDRLIEPLFGTRGARCPHGDPLRKEPSGSLRSICALSSCSRPSRGSSRWASTPATAWAARSPSVDGTGKVLDTAVVYPTHGERQKAEAIRTLSALIKKHQVKHHRHRQRHREPRDRADDGGAHRLPRQGGQASPMPSSTRRARPSIPRPSWRRRSSPNTTSTCARPSPSRGGCRILWRSSSRSTPSPSAWGSTSTICPKSGSPKRSTASSRTA